MTGAAYYLCEPKAENEVEVDEIQAKALAAAQWCKHATSVASKPWHYLLVPRTAVNESQTLKSLAAQYEVNQE